MAIFAHVWSHDMRHVELRELTGSQRTPGFWGVTDVFSSEDIEYWY